TVHNHARRSMRPTRLPSAVACPDHVIPAPYPASARDLLPFGRWFKSAFEETGASFWPPVGPPYLVSRNSWIDLLRPAVDPSRQRLRLFDSLPPQPNGNIQAAHAVMAIANDSVIRVECLQIRWYGRHRNQPGAFNSA